MKRSWHIVAVLVALLVASTAAADLKDKKSDEQVKFGNHQNRVSNGMFDDELYKTDKLQSVGQNVDDSDDSTEKVKPSYGGEGVDEGDERDAQGTSDGKDGDQDDQDDVLQTPEQQMQRITDNPYLMNRYFNPSLNTGNWNDYDKYYYYGQDTEEPTIFRKKRNMVITRPSDTLKRTPRKRAPLRTPLEQLMRAKSGLKRRSTRMKRELPAYYQEKLSELLTIMAIKEAREEVEKEKYLQSLPWKIQDQIMKQEIPKYEKEDKDSSSMLQGFYPYQLPAYITKELNEEANEGLNDDISNQEDDNQDDTDDDTPTFFRRPYQRRSESVFRRPYQRRSEGSTFYPAPSAYQWLLSGQKRFFSSGKWGPIDQKRSSMYDEEDLSDPEDMSDQVDPAKLYLFASLLDDEDDTVPLDSQLPLRKRLIL